MKQGLVRIDLLLLGENLSSQHNYEKYKISETLSKKDGYLRCDDAHIVENADNVFVELDQPNLNSLGNNEIKKRLFFSDTLEGCSTSANQAWQPWV